MSNNSRLFFVLFSLAAAIGISNIWLYPYFSYKFTGWFFIPYLIALFVLGVPLLMLEFSISQYFNKNVVDLFSSIRKWFSGIGWFMIFNAFVVMGFYAVVLSWHIIYLFVSFGLQWKNDAKGYFFNNALQVSDGFRNFTQFSLPVFIALILAWVLIFFYIKNGFESMKKAFLVTFPIFIILMFLFLLYSLTFDNALAGVYSFLKPSFKGLLDLNVWINSFSLTVLSLGLSLGVMHAIARKNKGFIVGASSIVVIFEILISIAIGFIVFSTLGFLSLTQGISLDKLVFSDFDSAFTILVQALPFFYKPTLLSILFFIFLSIFFIFGASALAYSISHVFVHKFKTKHINAAIIVAGFGFLFGLLFIIKPGFYIMDIVGHFVYYNILIAVLLEVIAVGWFFEAEKISDYINQYSILKMGMLWRFIVRYLIPLIVLSLLFVQLKSDFLLNYNNYPRIYVLIFGVGTVVIPLIAAFLMPQKLLDRR
ncbi:hypothetical protein HYX00_02795 [Candidatus Woesearchaeota archaeon]|nr:hypothetical protein [Candidatus Woesearchaeota archaeon]